MIELGKLFLKKERNNPNHGDGSCGLSKKITEVIIEKVSFLVPLDSETSTTADLVARFNHVVRKFAHFGVYFILGILLMNAFRTSGVRGFREIYRED